MPLRTYVIEMDDYLAEVLKNAGQIPIVETDMGQYKSAQDYDDERRSRLSAPPYYTPEEEKEVRAIRRNPALFDDGPEGEKLSARLRELKRIAQARRDQRGY